MDFSPELKFAVRFRRVGDDEWRTFAAFCDRGSVDTHLGHVKGVVKFQSESTKTPAPYEHRVFER